MNIGKKFEDVSSLEIAIQQYQKEENVQFFRRSLRIIEKAQPRMPDKKLNEPLKYYEISFHCICGGKNFNAFVVSFVSLSLSHWYPGSGVVLDCIDS